jgi:hypothetical protein
MTTEQTVIDLITNGGSLRKDKKGYYYIVPTTFRRSGKARVSIKLISKINKQLPDDKKIPASLP